MDIENGNSRSPKLLILAAEEFGFDLADRISARFPSEILDITNGTHPSMWPYAEMIILSIGMERPRIAEAIDETAFIRDIPWAAVTLSPTEITCGPVVTPGSSACYRCFDRRRQQHTPKKSGFPEPARLKAPTGYARHHVGIAFAYVLQSLDEALSTAVQEKQDASVRSFNLVSGSVSRSNVVAVDGCDRCRGRFGTREDARNAVWETLAEMSYTPLPSTSADHLVVASSHHG